MNFLDSMFKMFSNNEDNINNSEDVSIDQIIESNDFDDTLIAAWGGFK